jgi:putative tryptophan/tyrosine transport system substrate-binding protein
MMHETEKSDLAIVAGKSANNVVPAAEQSAAAVSRSGVDGAKGGDQGECGPAKHALDSEPGSRVTGAGTHTAGLCRHTPEVGAVCGKAARTDLGGGRAMKRTSLPLQRREFIAGLGGAVAWPLVARAQQSKPLIGFLYARSPEDTTAQMAAFHRGLSDGGYIEGQNVAIEYRWGRGQYDKIPAMAAELVHLNANLIVAGADQAALSVKAATSSLPIVFVVGSDPIKLGLVSSFNEPGGNATGVNIFTNDLQAKRIGLLHDLIPHTKMIGFLLNPTTPVDESQLDQVQTAATALDLEVQVLRASKPSEINDAFEAVRRDHTAAVLVAADPFLDIHHDEIIALAARYAVPMMYQFRQFPAAGGLMSYGVDLPDAWGQAGAYAARILKGAKPANLPVLRPTKFEFVINLKTAKALGITVPPSLIARADEVIE